MKEIFENIVLARNNLKSLKQTIGYLKKLIAKGGNQDVLSLPNEFDKYTVEEFLRLYKIKLLIEKGIVSEKNGETHRSAYIRHLELTKQIASELAKATDSSKEPSPHLSFLNQINSILIRSLSRYHILDPILDYIEFISIDVADFGTNQKTKDTMETDDHQIQL